MAFFILILGILFYFDLAFELPICIYMDILCCNLVFEVHHCHCLLVELEPI